MVSFKYYVSQSTIRCQIYRGWIRTNTSESDEKYREKLSTACWYSRVGKGNVEKLLNGGEDESPPGPHTMSIRPFNPPALHSEEDEDALPARSRRWLCSTCMYASGAPRLLRPLCRSHSGSGSAHLLTPSTSPYALVLRSPLHFSEPYKTSTIAMLRIIQPSRQILMHLKNLTLFSQRTISKPWHSKRGVHHTWQHKNPVQTSL
ncbi:hypothetical protein EV424DRAFT_949261 [Suillus variegatus]|nr:hypothetical protein EV424DRAFT_949261 [Suillus variegatus]